MSGEITASLSDEFELLRVRFYEISAKLLESDTRLVLEGPSSTSPVDKGNIDVNVSVKNEEDRLGCRVAVEFANERLVARIDCAVFFKKLPSVSGALSDEAIRSVSEEAVLVLIPYIREAMAEATRRVAGKPVMIGTVRLGDLAPRSND